MERACSSCWGRAARGGRTGIAPRRGRSIAPAAAKPMAGGDACWRSCKVGTCTLCKNTSLNPAWPQAWPQKQKAGVGMRVRVRAATGACGFQGWRRHACMLSNASEVMQGCTATNPW
eukprot:278782-Chlamydomonas_euryale.AAC.2